MSSRTKLYLAVMTVAALVVPARAQDKPASTATKPAPRMRLVPDPGWVKRHEGFVEIAKRGGIDVLFLGDSITDAWGGEGHSATAAGKQIFEKEFMPLKSANFGIGGDQTQHVLWRLQNSELDGIQPKVLMLMIGTNNAGSNTAEEIAAGVTAIVKEIHKRSPKTKVLLLGVFPRGDDQDQKRKEAVKSVREKIKKINEIISKLDDGGQTVKYLDISDKFLQPGEVLPKEIMPDYLHLSPKGYQIWADAVKGPIQELLGKNQ